MVVCNEADKYLGKVLSRHREYIDEAVIIDDGSIDDSAELCRELLSGVKLHLISNERPSFDNEVLLRRQQWQATVASSPEWILNMDADEIMEPAFAAGVGELLRQAEGDVGCFRLYDMWSETHYREDEYWRAHLFYRPMLLRYRSGFTYSWREQPLHCGRFPGNIFEQPSFTSAYRVQHWGWATPHIRTGKHRRYMELDPHGQYGWREQYESILDAHPRLVAWS
ncbi:glycosyltransferase [Paenibacillus athensensis]|uniref:Glycosyltransferase 2-like domain-containing protein n=2 Tax=Paenibacillus athensensis TaxID=1967502 RepID=A0A4Y8PRI0_9BACL|nr:glycosyltransferase [Paenibacillus athensensis]